MISESCRVGCSQILVSCLVFGAVVFFPLPAVGIQPPQSGPVKEKDPKQVQIEALQTQAELLIAKSAWDQANAICGQISAGRPSR